MPRNSVTGESTGAGGGQDVSPTAPALATAGTIDVSVDVARVTPAAAVTGVIMGAGTYPGQEVTVINEGLAASTITMAAVATSRVADGVTTVIPGLRASTFIWNGATWNRAA